MREEDGGAPRGLGVNATGGRRLEVKSTDKFFGFFFLCLPIQSGGEARELFPRKKEKRAQELTTRFRQSKEKARKFPRKKKRARGVTIRFRCLGLLPMIL